MPQLLAIHWNNREIHVAVAGGGDRKVLLEHAFSVPWNAEGPPPEVAESHLVQPIDDPTAKAAVLADCAAHGMG